MGTSVKSTAEWEAELGRWIRGARKNQQMTQQALADRASVSRSAIKYLEAGRGSSLATFLKVSRALGLGENLQQVFTTTTVSPLALLKASRKSAR